MTFFPDFTLNLLCGITIIKYLILPGDENYLAKEVIGLQIMGILTLFFHKSLTPVCCHGNRFSEID